MLLYDYFMIGIRKQMLIFFLIFNEMQASGYLLLLIVKVINPRQRDMTLKVFQASCNHYYIKINILNAY